MMFKLKIKLDEDAIMPVRAHEDDAGLDILCPHSVWCYSGHRTVIDTGVHVQIPKGYVGLLTSKSGLMKHGITTRGTIDSGYTGSIRAIVYNDGEGYSFERGDKITQLVILPCICPEIEVVDELEDTDRGDNGFGSTGK